MRSALFQLLKHVQDLAGARFTGTGLIITARPDTLPIVPLRTTTPVPAGEVAEFLAMASQPDSPFHDGFHVLSPDFKVLRVAQYFSPPIVPTARIGQGRLVGGRYVAALFGSALADVEMTGIASRASGVSVFQQGVDVSEGLPC